MKLYRRGRRDTMKFIIDNANIDEIRAMYEFFPMDGVTCNPSILAKEKI